MTVYKCNRCKKEIERLEKKYFEIGDMPGIDLCKPCYKDLLNFLEGKK